MNHLSLCERRDKNALARFVASHDTGREQGTWMLSLGQNSPHIMCSRSYRLEFPCRLMCGVNGEEQLAGRRACAPVPPWRALGHFRALGASPLMSQLRHVGANPLETTSSP